VNVAVLAGARLLQGATFDSEKPLAEIFDDSIEIASAASECDVAIRSDEILRYVLGREHREHTIVGTEKGRTRMLRHPMDPEEAAVLRAEPRKRRCIPRF
jgi:hypothetical protein